MEETSGQRISTRLTGVLKYVLPALWFALLAAFIVPVAMRAAPQQFLVVLVVVVMLAAAGAVFVKRRLWGVADEVRDRGDSLLVRSGRVVQTVAIKDIASVRVDPAIVPATVTLTLRQAGGPGGDIRFFPAGGSLDPFGRNRIGEELARRVRLGPEPGRAAEPRMASRLSTGAAHFALPLLLLPLAYALPLLYIVYETSSGKANLLVALFFPLAYLAAAAICLAASLALWLVVVSLDSVEALRARYYFGATGGIVFLLGMGFVHSMRRADSPAAWLAGFFAFWMIYALAAWACAHLRARSPSETTGDPVSR